MNRRPILVPAPFMERKSSISLYNAAPMNGLALNAKTLGNGFILAEMKFEKCL
jgi:hypothetical protein